MYGPVPTSRETSVPISSEPTLGGSSAAGGSASFCRHSVSGRVRWKVIVRPLAVMPRASVQVAGFCRHASAPSIAP